MGSTQEGTDQNSTKLNDLLSKFSTKDPIKGKGGENVKKDNNQDGPKNIERDDEQHLSNLLQKALVQDKFTTNSGSRTNSGTKKKKHNGSGSNSTGQQHLNNLLEKAMVQEKSTLKFAKNPSKPPNQQRQQRKLLRQEA